MAEAPHPRFASAIPQAVGLDVPRKAICAKNRSGLVLSTPPHASSYGPICLLRPYGMPQVAPLQEALQRHKAVGAR